MTDEGHDCNVPAGTLDQNLLRVSLPVIGLALLDAATRRSGFQRMGTRRRFCNCRLWRPQQPFDERLCFDEGSRRRRRRHGRSRSDEAYEELHALGFPSPTVHVVHRCSSRVCFCALTLALSGWPLASPLEGRVRRTSLREAEAACRAERGEQAMLALKLLAHNR